ncbi:NUDIX hydrolase [Phytoactinopolyspora endophytica]|uniref:NUDIX hydrolase n=1 Tax=Phytoactinopolyspora endophytica TaxID=1642495 RepID=UPI00101CA846|nr:NUDIX hydrolase [Phytoactinopolyspora endophytica]
MRMSASTDATTAATPTAGPWPIRRSLRYAALIAPTSIVGVFASLLGGDAAIRWHRRGRAILGRAPSDSGHRPGRLRLMCHALLGVLLGLVAWLFLGLIGLMVARGALYGFIDQGPYDGSWGGPSRGGAWLVHFAISLPVAALGLVVTAGVARLHDLLTRPLDGRRRPRWVLPVAFGASAGAALFFVAWLQQL